MRRIKEVFYVEKDAIKDRENGGMKDKWHKVGEVFERRSGSQVIKLDVIPVNFGGWLEIVEPKKWDEND